MAATGFIYSAEPIGAAAVNFSFATPETARNILTNRDAFINALSPFDRSARMQTDRSVSEEEFLAFLGENVRRWSPQETNALGKTLQVVQEKLGIWGLPFPPQIPLIKTTGREEGNASYTRQTAIVLPESELRNSAGLADTILHEVFHVLSRQNPELRKNLYGTIGFRQINQVEYPKELLNRKITNPDGVDNGWLISVRFQGQPISVVPVLFASSARYDLSKGGKFFDYLVFRLLAVAQEDNQWHPKLLAGHPELLDVQKVQGYVEQIGRNTDYIIHPDEILAVNFVHLINGDTNLPDPQILAGMKKVFRKERP
jgi:hypothetical protein